MLYWVLLLLSLSCCWSSVCGSGLSLDDIYDYDSYAAGPIVTTKYGQVEGNRRQYDRQVYEEYLGIPFAEPPVGDLRWQLPQPLSPWEGVWNATGYSAHCTQLMGPLYVLVGMGGRTGEDCLYLNIWVPDGVAANEGTKLPVMVFIYGGGFSFGTGEMYPGYALALHGNMVVVNFNYRLNALGWLSTGDDALPGNYGFYDVKAALRWVQENIADFAGDPNKVTVFGQSAGGVLASYASISPETRGLLHRSISISGASTGAFGLEQHPLHVPVMLADIFNCTDVQTSTDLVNCLRQIDDYSLAFWGTMGQMLYQDRVPSFKPVVDGVAIPMVPRDCWEQGYGQYVDLMTGSTYDDAAGFVIANPIGLPYLGDKGNMAATNESMWEALRLTLGDTVNEDELITDIILHYPDMDTTDNYTRTLAMTRAETELDFGSGSNWEANQHAGYGSGKGTYHYQFRYRPTFLTGYPEWVNGSHLDDIYSVLGEPFMKLYRKIYLIYDFNETDYTVSNTIMDYYTNFAYTGNPNVGPKPVSVEWTQFDPAKQNFLQEGVTCSVENTDPSVLENYRYWMDEFPLLAEYPPDPTFPLPDRRRRVTEEELMDAVDRFRELIRQMLPDNNDAFDIMMTIIDEMVEKRSQRL